MNHVLVIVLHMAASQIYPAYPTREACVESGDEVVNDLKSKGHSAVYAFCVPVAKEECYGQTLERKEDESR